jgi:hypothetical protein
MVRALGTGNHLLIGQLPHLTRKRRARLAHVMHRANQHGCPAYAGLFLTGRRGACGPACRSRARGAVPSRKTWTPISIPSSPRTLAVPRIPMVTVSLSLSPPRTRGCSDRGNGPHLRRSVVPAHAGLFRLSAASLLPGSRQGLCHPVSPPRRFSPEQVPPRRRTSARRGNFHVPSRGDSWPLLLNTHTASGRGHQQDTGQPTTRPETTRTIRK